MSRIGKIPVLIPDKVEASVKGNTVAVKGPKGTLEKSFDRSVTIKVSDGHISVNPANTSRLAKAMYGTARSIIDNMVQGVVSGFVKELDLNGVGFKAAVKGQVLDLALGYSHPIAYQVPKGLTITVSGNTRIKVEGIDKQQVGQAAAIIKAYYPIEPYKGKGVNIVGEFVRRKEGKKTSS